MVLNTKPIVVTLRIPGTWSSLQELEERLPAGFSMSEAELETPEGNSFQIEAKAADTEFFKVFQIACRQKPTPSELKQIENYTWNICLSGPGGSLESALELMQAASAILHAGGAGVFIDNSALSHGGEGWLTMTEHGGSDAVSFAFVNLAADPTWVRTIGLHVLGLPEIRMQRQDAGENGESIIEMIQYVCSSDNPVEHGHIIADLDGPRFRVTKEKTSQPLSHPTTNPFGSITLTSFKDIAESN